MLELTPYQKNLMSAYMVGIMTQVFTLFLLSQIYCDELEFSSPFAFMYIICAAIYFFLFLKLISSKV